MNRAILISTQFLFAINLIAQDFDCVGLEEESCYVLKYSNTCYEFQDPSDYVTREFTYYCDCLKFYKRNVEHTPGTWVAENCDLNVAKMCQLCDSEKAKKRQNAIKALNNSNSLSNGNSAAGNQRPPGTGDDYISGPEEQPSQEDDEAGASSSEVPVQDEERDAATKTFAGAAPVIGDAIGRFAEKRKQRKKDISEQAEKPSGHWEIGDPDTNWEMARAEGLTGISEGGWWEEVKSFFGLAATGSEVIGESEYSGAFGSASSVMGYAETVGHLSNAYGNSDNIDARMGVVQDAFGYLGDASGTAGTAFNKFGPPVDLHTRTFEGAFRRMNSLVTTGDRGNEIEVTAPLLNWFGGMTGMGDMGTREQRYRLERYKSFSEMQQQYGWGEAVKQKVYNWMRE